MTIVEDTPENMSSTTAFGHESDIEDTLNRAPEKCHYASLSVGSPLVMAGSNDVGCDRSRAGPPSMSPR